MATIPRQTTGRTKQIFLVIRSYILPDEEWDQVIKLFTPLMTEDNESDIIINRENQVITQISNSKYIINFSTVSLNFNDIVLSMNFKYTPRLNELMGQLNENDITFSIQGGVINIFSTFPHNHDEYLNNKSIITNTLYRLFGNVAREVNLERNEFDLLISEQLTIRFISIYDAIHKEEHKNKLILSNDDTTMNNIIFRQFVSESKIQFILGPDWSNILND